MPHILLAFMVAAFWAPLALAQRDPVGEVANFNLDRNSSRTSSAVRSGTLQTVVTRPLVDADGNSSFEVMTRWDLNVSLVGRQRGERPVDVPEEYFTEEFLVRLRADQYWEAPKFKMRHEGFATVRTMDGRVWADTDKIVIYDIRDSKALGAFGDLARSVLGVALEDAPSPTIDNLVIRGNIKFGVPVLGAVKIDVSGRYNGMNIKAGADYVSPAARSSRIEFTGETLSGSPCRVLRKVNGIEIQSKERPWSLEIAAAHLGELEIGRPANAFMHFSGTKTRRGRTHFVDQWTIRTMAGRIVEVNLARDEIEDRNLRRQKILSCVELLK
jgi:hypothetical protein